MTSGQVMVGMGACVKLAGWCACDLTQEEVGPVGKVLAIVVALLF